MNALTKLEKKYPFVYFERVNASTLTCNGLLNPDDASYYQQSLLEDGKWILTLPVTEQIRRQAPTTYQALMAYCDRESIDHSPQGKFYGHEKAATLLQPSLEERRAQPQVNWDEIRGWALVTVRDSEQYYERLPHKKQEDGTLLVLAKSATFYTKKAKATQRVAVSAIANRFFYAIGLAQGHLAAGMQDWEEDKKRINDLLFYTGSDATINEPSDMPLTEDEITSYLMYIREVSAGGEIYSSGGNKIDNR